jgi:dolichyl-diphosphooligosaccharide--protein glycosyltransferase
MKIRKLFSREKILEALKSLTAVRFRISHSLLLQASLLLLVLFLAFTVRLLPIRWGLYLSEFDPYYQYRVTKHAVENGLVNWATGWSETDPSRDLMSWYPYGRKISSTYPGLPLSAASSYLVAHALNLPLNVLEFCIIFPAMMGTLTCLAIYFLGRDIGGKHVGILSALFLALSSAHISRTSLGFFDDETVGICGLLLFFFFFLRSIESERPQKNSLVYAVAAGLSLGWIFASWGASRYAAEIVALFVFVLLLLRRYSSRLLFSYSTAFGIAVFIAVNVPKLGFSFLTKTSFLPVAAVFLLLSVYEITRHIKTPKNKAVFVFLFLGICIGLSFVLSSYGYITPMATKFWYAINPLQRFENPLTQSVQEHRPAAWGSFYYDFGIGAFFMPVGLFFAVRNPTNRNIFLTIFGLTSIYFACSMVRLTLILAPAISLLWALALARLIKPFTTVMKAAPIIPRRGTGLAAHVGKEFSGAFLIVMFVLLTLTFVLPTQRVFDHAYSPTTIAAASMPIKAGETVNDWIDTLKWIRTNESVKVVASWWDYGYWITNLGNKTSLADNGTWNQTQIAQIGKMFMSDEADAVKILQKYHATHIVVFVTCDSQGRDVGWGDEGKWMWMARIADSVYGGFEYDETNHIIVGYQELTTDEQGQTSRVWTEKGKQTVIYKLMAYAKDARTGSSHLTYPVTHFEPAYFSEGRDYGGVIPLVCVYKVKYTT